MLLGDKGKGKQHYATFNSTYIPDLIKTGDAPEIAEFKNYSYAVRAQASAPGPTTHHGDRYAMGNTEEPLKHTVLGTRQRGHAVEKPFDHGDGGGFVRGNMDKAHYRDARLNRKAVVRLLVHETSGGMSDYSAKYLRKLARDALDIGFDVTAYQLSYTARSFVPYFAQRISNAIVMRGVDGIHKGISRMQCARLRRARAA